MDDDAAGILDPKLLERTVRELVPGGAERAQPAAPAVGDGEWGGGG